MSGQTAKHDWYTRQLASQSHVFLSDDDIIHKLLDVPTGGEFSLRYVGNKRIGLRAVIIAKSEMSGLRFLDAYPDETLFLSRLAKVLFKCPVPIITAQSMLSGDLASARFGVFNTETKTVSLLDADGLAKGVFAKMDPDMVADSGAVDKAVNKTMHDDFHLFTREKLSRYLVVNDIDGILFGGTLCLLELKRIAETAEGLAKWKPYLDDYRNYQALRQLANSLHGAKVRVVAYTKDPSDLVSIHEIDQIDDIVLRDKTVVREPATHGRSLLCAVADSLGVTLGQQYVSDTWRVRRDR